MKRGEFPTCDEGLAFVKEKIKCYGGEIFPPFKEDCGADNYQIFLGSYTMALQVLPDGKARLHLTGKTTGSKGRYTAEHHTYNCFP